MSVIPIHAPATPTDPTIAVVERQLAMLAAAAEMAMEVTRGYAAAALAASNAVEVILADEYYQPETGRARALAGAKDAAEAFQKTSRSLRLTLAQELTTAETLRDLRNGVVVNRKAGEESGAPALAAVYPTDSPRSAGSRADDTPDRERREQDVERLVEFDLPDRLPRGGFRELVGGLCAEIGAAPDWNAWTVRWPKLKYQPMTPRPPGWETRPPGSYPPDAPDRVETTDAPPNPPPDDIRALFP